MIPFIRNLIGVKTDQAVQGALETLVQWDPRAATEAELMTMEQHLDNLGRQVAEARQGYERERKEADAIQALSNQRMAAAEQLQRQVEAATDPQRRSDLESSLATLVKLLEDMAPEVDREAQDARDAREFLEMLEKAYADAGTKLKQARHELGRAHRDMARAGQQREMAEQKSEAARRAAGLSGATSSLNVALKAMQDRAAGELAAAEAANAKAKLLTPTRPEQDDQNIARAMATVSGTATTPTNLQDRLAALRTRQGGQIGHRPQV